MRYVLKLKLGRDCQGLRQFVTRHFGRPAQMTSRLGTNRLRTIASSLDAGRKPMPLRSGAGYSRSR